MNARTLMLLAAVFALGLMVLCSGVLAIQLTDEGQGVPMFGLLLAMNASVVAAAALCAYLVSGRAQRRSQ